MAIRTCLTALGLCAALAFASAAHAQPPNMSTLHDALHLTADQEAGWNAYKASVSVPTQDQQRRRSAAMMFPTLTAPRRMALIEAEMQQALAELRHQAQALNAFYGTLTPSQQRVFDTQTLPPSRDGGED